MAPPAAARVHWTRPGVLLRHLYYQHEPDQHPGLPHSRLALPRPGPSPRRQRRPCARASARPSASALLRPPPEADPWASGCSAHVALVAVPRALFPHSLGSVCERMHLASHCYAVGLPILSHTHSATPAWCRLPGLADVAHAWPGVCLPPCLQLDPDPHGVASRHLERRQREWGSGSRAEVYRLHRVCDC